MTSDTVLIYNVMDDENEEDDEPLMNMYGGVLENCDF